MHIAQLMLSCMTLDGLVYMMTHKNAVMCPNNAGVICVCNGNKPTPFCMKSPDAIACNKLESGVRVSD